jgi:hypothetical protein
VCSKLFGVFECAYIRSTIDGRCPVTLQAPTFFDGIRYTGKCTDRLWIQHAHVAADAGDDTFVKQRKSLFVFFQDHPEYESNTLLVENRRDITRCFRGETNAYPSMPSGYFDRAVVTVFDGVTKRGDAPSE